MKLHLLALFFKDISKLKQYLVQRVSEYIVEEIQLHESIRVWPQIHRIFTCVTQFTSSVLLYCGAQPGDCAKLSKGGASIVDIKLI